MMIRMITIMWSPWEFHPDLLETRGSPMDGFLLSKTQIFSQSQAGLILLAGWAKRKTLGRISSEFYLRSPASLRNRGRDEHSPLVDGVDVWMEEPQLLRVVLPRGQDQVVASQTQGPLNGRIERSVKHHIVHPWGLNQLRKLHVPQQPEPADYRVREEGG